jgi:CheY-like chemotaxis protein
MKEISVKDSFVVLVVDDDLDIRETLREVIEAEGFQVSCAANGAEAMHLLGSGMRPDLIILDLMMPVMSGWEFLAKMRGDEALASIPVAVVSASGGKTPPVGATCFFRKPIELDTILGLVREHSATMRSWDTPVTQERSRSHA